MSWAQGKITRAAFLSDQECYDAIVAGVTLVDTGVLPRWLQAWPALEGTRNIPQNGLIPSWATLQNEYTVSQRLLRPTAQGITGDYQWMNRKSGAIRSGLNK